MRQSIKRWVLVILFSLALAVSLCACGVSDGLVAGARAAVTAVATPTGGGLNLSGGSR